jgi:acetyltransferase-like isoleucine patch superfamily enzyme
VVAAGAVVIEAVPPHCLVAGNPARVKKSSIPGYNNYSV